MKGVDVSYHNGTINWKKVAASDVDYAIIRCGYGDNIKSQDDKKWAENVAGCEKTIFHMEFIFIHMLLQLNRLKAKQIMF